MVQGELKNEQLAIPLLAHTTISSPYIFTEEIRSILFTKLKKHYCSPVIKRYQLCYKRTSRYRHRYLNAIFMAETSYLTHRS
jgi:hypothetical protein